jgi:hypothetical protein
MSTRHPRTSYRQCTAGLFYFKHLSFINSLVFIWLFLDVIGAVRYFDN